MRSILDRIDQPLTWRQPRFFHRAFELTAPDGEVLGALRWRNIFTDRADASCADGSWTFRRTRLFSRHVVIEREGSDVEAGSFTRGFFGGKLELAGGREVRIRLVRVWTRRWSVIDDSGKVLFHVTAAVPFLKDRARVVIAPEAAGDQDLPLLTLFAWYHIVHVRHRGDAS